jgi:hypothetical protein
MQNWKDKLLILLTALMALLGLETAYQYNTPAPESYEQTAGFYAAPSVTLGDEDINADKWTVLVSYKVAQEVAGPPSLPAGYSSAYTYTWPVQVVIYSRTAPKLADITVEPPALKGETFMAVSYEVLSHEKPGKKPREEQPETPDNPIQAAPEI